MDMGMVASLYICVSAGVRGHCWSIHNGQYLQKHGVICRVFLVERDGWMKACMVDMCRVFGGVGSDRSCTGDRIYSWQSTAHDMSPNATCVGATSQTLCGGGSGCYVAGGAPVGNTKWGAADALHVWALKGCMCMHVCEWRCPQADESNALSVTVLM